MIGPSTVVPSGHAGRAPSTCGEPTIRHGILSRIWLALRKLFENRKKPETKLERQSRDNHSDTASIRSCDVALRAAGPTLDDGAAWLRSRQLDFPRDSTAMVVSEPFADVRRHRCGL